MNKYDKTKNKEESRSQNRSWSRSWSCGSWELEASRDRTRVIPIIYQSGRRLGGALSLTQTKK